jgi:uncharacterized protein (TIGR03086 family)
MPSLLEQHAKAVAEFGSRVHTIKHDQWDDPTPCTGWDVRTLVNHLVNEQLWVPPLMSGATVADVGDALDGDLLGDDPVAAWDAAAAASSAALHEPGALERTVHLSFADVPGSVYAWQLIGDLTIHAWDLARGIGADDRLDSDLAAEVMVRLEPDVATYASYGLFSAPTALPADADVQSRLIAMSGRQP